MESTPFSIFCDTICRNRFRSWDHLRSNFGIICGTGIICRLGSFAGPYRSVARIQISLNLCDRSPRQNKRKLPCRSVSVDEATCRRDVSQRCVAAICRIVCLGLNGLSNVCVSVIEIQRKCHSSVHGVALS